MPKVRPVFVASLTLLALLIAPSEGASQGPRRANIAPVPSSLPSQLSVTLPTGEGLSLVGHQAMGIYPQASATQEGSRAYTHFVIDAPTRARLVRLVWQEVKTARRGRYAPPLLGTRRREVLDVSCYYSARQTGGKSKVELARRDMRRSSTINARALVELVEEIVRAHRHDDDV